MTRYALIIEYDGSLFHGWQKQLGNVATIQQYLEFALSKFATHKIDTITAGRTDTGVHALNQVVHFDSDAKRQLAGWVSGVNAHLPPSIRVKKSLQVTPNFDARMSAISRTYHYYLYISPKNSAIIHRNVGWYYQQLDIAKMQQAALCLVGQHDFSSFRASGCQARNAVRIMHDVAIEQRGNMIRFSLTANAFLYHMVRNIVGALIYVGKGSLSVERFQQIFVATDRKLAPATFMANGLYLVDVQYKPSITDFNPEIWLFNQ